jgi:hypothetical protein
MLPFIIEAEREISPLWVNKQMWRKEKKNQAQENQ